MRCSANGVTLRGPVSDSEIVDVWPKAEAYLAAALERDGWKMHPEDVLKDLSDGVAGLYIIEDDVTGDLIGALTCESMEYPHSSVFVIGVCGGRELYRWAGLMGAMEQEAARLGCDTVRISGRKGWGAVFPDYTEMHRVFERRIVQ